MRVYVGRQQVQIKKYSLRITEAIEERSTCEFVVWDEAGSMHFTKGQPVRVETDDGALAFAGFVNDVTEQKLAPGDYRLWHTVRCVDMHYLADKRIVSESYTDTTAGDIVRDLIAKYLGAEGVQATAESVQEGPTIHSTVLNYVPASQALDALAQAAGFTWWIGYDRVLWFCDRTAVQAPYAADNSIARRGSVTLQVTADLYRNRQYVRGGQAVTDPQTEVRVGDGSTRSFALGFPLAEEPTILVNGQPQTVGIKGVDTGRQWFWNKGDAVITQDDSVPPLTASDTLQVTYRGLFNIIVLSQDDAAIIDRQNVEGGGTGMVED
ncbi:MAG: hypothetical protein IRZ18_09725, partial [Clostridia bacterium]|nr:hypothetical protein [Clostridia bacterium]